MKSIIIVIISFNKICTICYHSKNSNPYKIAFLFYPDDEERKIQNFPSKEYLLLFPYQFLGSKMHQNFLRLMFRNGAHIAYAIRLEFCLPQFYDIKWFQRLLAMSYIIFIKTTLTGHR